MDLRQIQYFVALFEERSITKAARRLNVVQPAISMQIGRLEKKSAQLTKDIYGKLNAWQNRHLGLGQHPRRTRSRIPGVVG